MEETTETSETRTKLATLHQTLLAIERAEEKKRQKQLKEEDELCLKIDEKKYEDKVLLVVLKPESGKHLPKHGLELGNQVIVSQSPVGEVIEHDDMGRGLRRRGGLEVDFRTRFPYAVVTGLTKMELTLSFSREVEFLTVGNTVYVSSIENSDYSQLSAVLSWLKNVEIRKLYARTPAASTIREMFKEHEESSVSSEPDATEAVPFACTGRSLDSSQRQAVALALRDRPLTVIHGPPGTGKTTTVVEVIMQHVKRAQRVLVCAPSNKAVDNVLEGVWKQTMKADCELDTDHVIRLGQLERINKDLRDFSLDAQLEKYLEKKEKEKERKNLLLYRPYQREELVENAKVVLSTLTSVRSVCEGTSPFDLLVIDECGQATEAACWLAIPLAKKVMLVGDPCQLPPTILSQEAASRGLAVSLMERQMKLHGEGIVHMLDTQYRMHAMIQEWSSQNLYGGRLKAAPTVASHLLTQLPSVQSTSQTQPTLMLVDTAGCRLLESQDAKTKSYCNKGEANLVVCHVSSLVKAGVSTDSIGVITPYKQQVGLITGRLRDANLNVEVNSVDGFQGREKEAILLSLVRSNPRRQVGFVGDRRRLNVAVTRARRHLFVVCDTSTVCQDRTIRSLVSHLRRNGELRETSGKLCPHGKTCQVVEDDDDVDDLAFRLGATNLRRTWKPRKPRY
ncbi:DNA-binding protein SMUBP-2-like [Amphibalanus amphitrite]|uniref:DNA-binding protein SMUBP-2-like n=1 Tax=Amphibalanus amphitrite TaxID=1232801 RepID=UPI001C8FECEE|nr:DNA-binding protein SMUBP-2-like [Amphibalanus amphitrite]